jgi:hypothetical protein
MRQAKKVLLTRTAQMPTEVARSQQSPLPGNSPNDRILHGPGFNRHKRVCVHSFPATSWPPSMRQPRLRFLRHGGIYRSDRVFKTKPRKPGTGMPPPVGRPPAPVQGRDGRSVPRSSSAMSSGRLFLDRVARQQSPSPLHRHGQINMHFSNAWRKGDISTLHERGTFLFCLDKLHFGGSKTWGL